MYDISTKEQYSKLLEPIKSITNNHLFARAVAERVVEGEALIDYCLENGFEPVWACKRDNAGSYQLAQKLGFENVKEISYYRLGLD